MHLDKETIAQKYRGERRNYSKFAGKFGDAWWRKILIERKGEKSALQDVSSLSIERVSHTLLFIYFQLSYAEKQVNICLERIKEMDYVINDLKSEVEVSWHYI